MTRLIVSVRNAAEACEALAVGAHLIDIKEPSRGSLGPADLAVVREVIAASPSGTAVSVALGELLEPSPPLLPDDLSGIQFAKLGLAGCAVRNDWKESWLDCMSQFPDTVRRVAVVYADAAAEAPPWEDILSMAGDVGATAILVDTYDKRGGGLLSHWPLDLAAEFVDRARQAELISVLAGSLDLAAIKQILSFSPDFVAVRGAVCTGGRGGRLDPQLVDQLVTLLESSSNLDHPAGHLEITRKK